MSDVSFRPKRPQAGRPLNVECFDDRIVPAVSAITSSFNATPIAADSTVWFSSVLKVSGLSLQTTSVRVEGGTISAPDFTVQVPNAEITFSPLVLVPVTTFNAATNTWHTMAPSTGLSGNVFIAGAALQVPIGLPGGENPVTWNANFISETPGLSATWKWSAAVYSNFNTNMNAVGVKPADGLLGGYLNFHSAGTPENYASFVTGGARGNGGSNYTGSYTATGSVTPDRAPPPSGISLSGSVYIDADWSGARDNGETGIESVVLHMTGFDLQGNEVTRTTTTDANGNYTFANLPAGTYQLQEDQPRYIDAWETVGTVNGETRGEILDDDLIGNISLGNGDIAVGYDFAELLDSPN